MLTRDQFDEWFRKIEINFSKQNTTSIAEFFWKEFNHLSLREWTICCQNILDNEEFFPKKSTFSKYLQRLGRSKEYRKDCAFCDGYGWTYTTDRAFRAGCEHGRELSRSIPTNDEATPKVPAIQTDLDRKKLAQGVEWCEKNGLKVPEFVKKKVEMPF